MMVKQRYTPGQIFENRATVEKTRRKEITVLWKGTVSLGRVRELRSCCFTFSQLYGDADPAGPVSVASGNSISRQLQTGWNSKNLSSNSDLTVCGWNEQNGTFQAKISNSRL